MSKDNSFVVLFDYDSMVYKAVWFVASAEDGVKPAPPMYPKSFRIREWIKEGRSREWMESEIVNLTINRLEQMGNNIFMDIEDTGVNIAGVEYFLTACKNSARKTEEATYKADRKPNKWVNKVRRHLLEMGFAAVHDEWEADDLIKDRAIDIGVDKCIICTIDKDLKQIPGFHFNYFRPLLRDQNGKYIIENGRKKRGPCKGLSFVNQEEADLFFWTQVITGDSGDNIKGIPRVGPARAKKIIDEGLSEGLSYEEIAKGAYVKYFGDEEGERQFDLHKLLIGLGVKYRP